MKQDLPKKSQVCCMLCFKLGHTLKECIYIESDNTSPFKLNNNQYNSPVIIMYKHYYTYVNYHYCILLAI